MKAGRDNPSPPSKKVLWAFLRYCKINYSGFVPKPGIFLQFFIKLVRRYEQFLIICFQSSSKELVWNGFPAGIFQLRYVGFGFNDYGWLGSFREFEIKRLLTGSVFFLQFIKRAGVQGAYRTCFNAAGHFTGLITVKTVVAFAHF